MRIAKAKRARNSDVRLLHAVIGVAGILFVLKAGGLAFSASAAPAAEPKAQGEPAPAQAAQAAAPAQTPKAPAPATPAKPAASGPGGAPLPGAAADPLTKINAALPNPQTSALSAPTPTGDKPLVDGLTADASGAPVSSAEIDVLTSLAERREALDERQRELDLKTNVITAAEKRVDEKIAQLKALQAKIEQLLGERDAKELAQIDGLVKIYTAMKPKDAARIFNTLDDEVRIGVAGRMKADAMAGIFAALPPEVAQKLTVELASRFKMPADAAASALAAVPPQPRARAPAGGQSAVPAATPAPAAPAAPKP